MSGEFPTSPSGEGSGYEDGFIGFNAEALTKLAKMALISENADMRPILLIRIENTLAERLKHLDEDDPEYHSYEVAREYLRPLTDEMLNRELLGRSELEN